MLAQVGSASVAGVESRAVSVEANISVGLPAFVIVGLPHGAVREGRERVMAALSRLRVVTGCTLCPIPVGSRHVFHGLL